MRKVLEKGLDNPVLLKELRLAFREKWILIGFALLLVLASLICLSLVFGKDLKLDQLQTQGEKLFVYLCYFQVFCVLVLAPSLSATSIVGERQRQTLASMLNSRLTPLDIVLGKFFYSFGMCCLLLVLLLPIEATVFFLGGVTPTALLLQKVLLGALAVLAVAASLQSSAKATGSAKATSSAFGNMFFIFLVVALNGVLSSSSGFVHLVGIVVCLLALVLGVDYLLNTAILIEERPEYFLWRSYLSLAIIPVPVIALTFVSFPEPLAWTNTWSVVTLIMTLTLASSFIPPQSKRPIIRAQLNRSLVMKDWFSFLFYSIWFIAPILLFGGTPLVHVAYLCWLFGVCVGFFGRGWCFGRPAAFNFLTSLVGLGLLFGPLLFINREEQAIQNWSPEMLSPFSVGLMCEDGRLQSVPLETIGVYVLLALLGLLGLGFQKLFKVKH